MDVSFPCIFGDGHGQPSRSIAGVTIEAGAAMQTSTFREGPLMMTKTFEIDGIAYEITYENHRFLFTIDPARSTRCVVEYDPFGAFHDELPERISLRSPQTATRSIFKVKREVMRFIDQALRKYKPYYFTFAANEHAKISLYRRIAERIARTHGFTLYADPELVASESRWARFSFYYQVAI